MNATVQFDAIHDINAMGLDPTRGVIKDFITSEIPVGGEAASRDGRTGFSPNQSLLKAWAQTPTDLGLLRGFVDVNLAKLEVETEFQVYKVYGQWGWLKAGLDYTLFLNQAAAPDTLDFEGPNSIPFVRFPQFSLNIPFEVIGGSPDCSVIVGLEDAPADVTLPASVIDADTLDRLPSVITKLVYKPENAHIEVTGLYRHLDARGVGYRSQVDGWGVAVSGSINTWGQDNLILAGQVGRALGAYSQDTNGFGLDAAPRSASDPLLRPIPAAGAWAAYKHWWNNRLRSTASYGVWSMRNNFDQTPNAEGTFHQSHYASANIIWSPTPPIDIGIEYLYGHRRVTDNTPVDGSFSGEDHRLQATVRWNFGYTSRSND